MHFFKGLAGVLAGTGLIATGATVVVGCGEDFDGCEASKTCGSGAAGGNGGMSGSGGAGHGGTIAEAGADPSGGKGGSAAGKAGSSAAGTAGRGGTGGMSNGESGEGGEAPARGGTSGGGTTSTDNGGESGDAGKDSGPPVNEAPRILATSPEHGEKGVLADTDIVVTFSEPMDSATTQNAYSSVSLPADEVELFWQENGTKLVIRPKQQLVYADVDTFTSAAKSYDFTIGGTATDITGQSMGQDRTFVFTTMRHISAALKLPGKEWSLDIYHPSDGSPDNITTPCVDESANIVVGDYSGKNSAIVAITAFDLGVIPDGVIEWSSAKVRADFTTTELNPFQDLGDLIARQVIGQLDSFGWATPSAGSLGVVATHPSMGDFGVDVLDAVKDEYEYRNERPFAVQFRFQEDRYVDDKSSYVMISCGSLRLEISLTAP